MSLYAFIIAAFIRHIFCWDSLILISADVNQDDVFLTQDDFDNAANLEFLDNYQFSEGAAQLEESDLWPNIFEGDILGLNTKLKEEIKLRLWKDAQMPYTLSSRYTSYGRRLIAKAISEIEAFTCIKFIPKNASHSHYVHIEPDISGQCFSNVGRVGGPQILSLNEDCMQVGSIIHELLHALGFVHEQSRPDRDKYVKIFWSNIARRAEDQFEKYTYGHEHQLSFPYDYSSVMHYGPYAFTRNGLPTIRALKKGGEGMGQREGMSVLDVKKLNVMYQCRSNVDSTEKRFPSTRFTTQSPSLARTPLSAKFRTTSKSTGAESCRDRSSSCSLWRILDNICNKYPSFMRYNCPKTCNFCNIEISKTTESILKATTTSSSTAKCQDEFPISCKWWTEMEDCKSTRSNSFMRKYCRASCGLCNNGDSKLPKYVAKNTTTDNCTDFKYSCGIWASDGLCRNDDYVRRHCPKKCGLCPVKTANLRKLKTEKAKIQDTKQYCINRYHSCDRYAQYGLCNNSSIANFIKARCPISCGTCVRLL